MSGKRTIWAAAFLMVSTPALAADQFDLICTAGKVAEHYRVDLARAEWCFDKCELVQKIASITSGVIILAEHAPTHRGDATSYNKINRVTGEWQWYFLDPKLPPAMDISGSCDPKEFSGMAADNRKF